MTKVLIIEDDPIIANIYRSRLDKEGFQVEIAPDGQTGFYRIHEVRPDAILLDLMLPKMDGIQILKKIRAQKQFQQVPVLVFTNAYLPNMIQEAKQAGATQVFNKAALTPKQVVDAFNQALFPGAMPAREFPPATASAPPPSIPAESPDGLANPDMPAPPPASHSGTASISRVGPAFAASSLGSAPVSSGVKSSVSALSQGGIPFPQMPAAVVPAALPAAAAPSAAPVTAHPTISGESDAEFQAELLRAFLESTPETLNALRRNLHEFLKGGNEGARMAQLMEFYRKVHALTGNAAIVGLQNIAQMGAALEALLKELNDKPKNITPSASRTLAHATDFLGVLFEKGRGPSLIESPPVNILVVDDEIISRRAVVYALDKARLKSEAVEDPMAAMRLLGEKTYDLVILDVDMPGMNGFELCTKLRAMPANQTTPVVFVTGLTDFESRARSSLSGGNDLIAKPFLFIELTVKALTFVMKQRLFQRRIGA